MKTKVLVFVFAAASLLAAMARASAAELGATLMPGGSVKFSCAQTDCVLQPVMFLKGWISASCSGGYELGRDGLARFRMARNGVKYADCTLALSQLEEGAVRIDWNLAAMADCEIESLCCQMTLPSDAVEGCAWRTENAKGTFSKPADGGIRISNGRCASFGLVPGNGFPPLRFVSTNTVEYLVQDNRRWGATYCFRLGRLGFRRMAKGDAFSLSFVVRSSSPITAAGAKSYVVTAGEEWIPVDYRRDVIEGSALDFSRMGFVDAPAGKHGWLKNIDGHFEFECLPGRRQKFYGLNLCGTANFPDHELAEILVKRFKRLGYNTLRIHHHDAGMVESSPDGVTLDAANMERFDYFAAAAIREGLYLTIDVYVSRARKIKWRHIGVDRDGCVDMQLFKALCAVYEPAFENWAAFAANFFTHVNPYTGRSYADEPAMPLISLVNEGGFFMGWTQGVRDDPRILASWGEWLARKRKADPSFAPEADPGKLPASFWSPKENPAVIQWMGDLEARMVARMKARLRALGVKALLTNDNCGPHFAALQRATGDYDYIDDHFYVDHPHFPEKPWSLPSTCPNKNPLLGEGPLAPSAQAFTRMVDKPFTITEWNFSGPGRYRGVGGILTGAMAALQDWDGLWRFAYSHSRDGLRDADVRSPGYFDVSSDPLAQAGERACMMLFLRGDLAPYSDGVLLWDTPESAAAPETAYPGAPKWRDVAWKMRTGSCLSPEVSDNMRVIRREVADGDEPSGEGTDSLRLDRERGSFVIDTPRTSGGFAEEGAVVAGNLRAKISGAPATVWVHSLDGAEIPRSRRLLLTHVTDVQGEGARYSDDSMTTTLKWGARPLMRNGSAKVAVKHSDAEHCVVYALETSGRRLETIPAEAKDGWLVFTVSVASPQGARTLYEIAVTR